MKSTQLFVVATAFMACISAANAADWQVRRNNGNGACSLQPSDSQPILGKLLATKPTKKEACTAAKELKTDDQGDTNKCQTYTNNSVAICHAEGVDLQQ